jgi:hypothetical protein
MSVCANVLQDRIRKIEFSAFTLLLLGGGRRRPCTFICLSTCTQLAQWYLHSAPFGSMPQARSADTTQILHGRNSKMDEMTGAHHRSVPSIKDTAVQLHPPAQTIVLCLIHFLHQEMCSYGVHGTTLSGRSRRLAPCDVSRAEDVDDILADVVMSTHDWLRRIQRGNHLLVMNILQDVSLCSLFALIIANRRTVA